MHVLVELIIRDINIDHFARYSLVEHADFIVNLKGRFDALSKERLSEGDIDTLYKAISTYWSCVSKVLRNLNKEKSPMSCLAKFIIAFGLHRKFFGVKKYFLSVELLIPIWMECWVELKWDKRSDIQDTVNCLYHYSKLVRETKQIFIKRENLIAFISNNIEELMTSIDLQLFAKHKNAEDTLSRVISNLILALGYLSLENCVTQLQPIHVQQIFHHLVFIAPRLRDPTQPLANFILGLGYLAKQGGPVQLEAQTVDAAFQILIGSKEKTTEPTHPIGSFVLGVGYLACAGCVIPLSVDCVNSALKIFVDTVAVTKKALQHRGNLFLGIGYLALSRCPVKLDECLVLKIFQLMLDRDYGDEGICQVISNFISSLGYLADQGYPIQVTGEQVEAALNILIKYAPKAERIEQNISKFILGVGFLAVKGCSVKLCPRQIKLAFEIIMANAAKQESLPSYLADFIWGLGFWARAEHCSSPLDMPLIHVALKILCNAGEVSPANMVMINKFYLGIGYLALGKCVFHLEREIIQKQIQIIIDYLIKLPANNGSEDKPIQAIANLYWALGCLANKYRPVEIDSTQIKTVFQIIIARPQLCHNFPLDIANLFLCLGHYATRRAPVTLDMEQVHVIMGMLGHYKAQMSKYIKEFVSVLWSLAMYAQNGTIIYSEDVRAIACEVFDNLDSFEKIESKQFLIFLCSFEAVRGKNTFDFPGRLRKKLEQEVQKLAHSPLPLQHDMKAWLIKTYNFPQDLIYLEHLVGGYYVDIVVEFNNKKIIIDLDGAHHYDAEGNLGRKEKNRDNHLTCLGWKVLRLKNQEARMLLAEGARHIKILLDQLIIEATNSLLLSGQIKEKHEDEELNTFMPIQRKGCGEDAKNERHLRVHTHDRTRGLATKLMKKAIKKLNLTYVNMVIEPSESKHAISLLENVIKIHKDFLHLLPIKIFDDLCHQLVDFIAEAVYKKSKWQCLFFCEWTVTHGIRFDNTTWPHQALSLNKLENLIDQCVKNGNLNHRVG